MRALLPKSRITLSRFRREEDGSIVVFTLFILVLMLIVSGMAVDFMRFESRRAALQGCIDNAVLAAADLDQDGTVQEVKDLARDWFDKAECEGVLVADPKVTPGTEYREVSATGELVLNTFFLRLIGMDTLKAGATSTAVEGVGEVEVSLVLDISGSMAYTAEDDTGAPIMFENDDGSFESRTKIRLLRDAAEGFVQALLKPEYADKISISLVPYSEHVNIGEELFDALNTNQTHDFSYCVEIDDADFNTVVFDTDQTYDQMQHWQWNPGTMESPAGSGNFVPDVEDTICPRMWFEQIIPISQNLTQLEDSIELLTPRAGTSIFMGLKWGVTLLDPSIKPVLAKMPASTIETTFDNRPAPYLPDAGSASTIKYIVLMTDGENQWSNRLHDDRVDDPSEIMVWERHNWASYNDRLCSSGGYCYNYGDYYSEKYNATLGDTLMQQMCTQAKDAGIIIFTIAMDSTTHGEQQMRLCASSPSHYHETQGDALIAIFDAIAAQITDLRLTL